MNVYEFVRGMWNKIRHGFEYLYDTDDPDSEGFVCQTQAVLYWDTEDQTFEVKLYWHDEEYSQMYTAECPIKPIESPERISWEPDTYFKETKKVSVVTEDMLQYIEIDWDHEYYEDVMSGPDIIFD